MASAVYRWKVWCSTDSKWESVYLPSTDAAPTTCPVNTTHVIDPSLTNSSVFVKSNDVDLANVPTTSDGRLIISPAVFSGDQNLNYPGVGDNVVTGARGADAQRFLVDASVDTRDANNDIIREWRFIDHTYVQGGEVSFSGGGKNDYVDMDIYVPASVHSPSVGGNTGNANAVVTGLGYNILVPAPLLDGAVDVDISSALSANLTAKVLGDPSLVTVVSPVPAIKKVGGVDTADGYWNVDMTTGIIASAIGPAGEKLGFWNLFDTDIILVRWVSKLSLWNLNMASERSIVYRVPVKAKKVLANWVCRSKWHIEGASPVFAAVWHLYTARGFTS